MIQKWNLLAAAAVQGASGSPAFSQDWGLGATVTRSSATGVYLFAMNAAAGEMEQVSAVLGPSGNAFPVASVAGNTGDAEVTWTAVPANTPGLPPGSQWNFLFFSAGAAADPLGTILMGIFSMGTAGASP
jgi:hypothetical protein